MVRRRGGLKRAMGTRAPMLIPMAPNDRWSLDFVPDQMTDGRRFRVLTVVDDCTRMPDLGCRHLAVWSARCARELETLMATRGRPKMIVSDNGLSSRPMPSWASPTGWGSTGTTLPLASRSRMPSSRALTPGFGTNCSTRPCSHRLLTSVPPWRLGATITICTGRTRGWVG